VRLFVLFFSLILSFSLFSATKDSLNILFIGNSYTHMNSMPKIFDKLCKSKGKTVHVEMNTKSGASFQVHAAREDLFVSIRSRKWDYVILQGFSREFSLNYDDIDKETIPYLSKIIDSIDYHNPCSTKLFYLTWGYRDGYKENSLNDTYDKMAVNIINGYKYISSCFDYAIVPVGQVWKNFRSKYPDINLYDQDNAHPNKNGSYLSACTFYSSIFRESSEGAITSTIDYKIASKIQKTASEFVLANLNDLQLDRNFYEINSEVTKSGKYKVTLKAVYSNSAKYTWDLGNGDKKEGKEIVYYYKKPGKYKVSLVVDDYCGTRNFMKTIRFEAPKKPSKNTTSKPKKSTSKRKY